MTIIDTIDKNENYTRRLFVIDNYDSFTYNLVQMFTPFNLEIIVRRSDKITIEELSNLTPDYLLISPGPKDPTHAGISKNAIAYFYNKIPILGVCLGMQCLNEVFGGRTKRAPVPVHGKTDMINHKEQGIFKGLSSPFLAARYHSLIVEPINPVIVTTAWNCDGIIMGIELTGFPVYGVQFHPESFMTENGEVLIHNFLHGGFYGF